MLNPSYKGACVYVGAMTHTGASGMNEFVACAQRLGGSAVSGSSGSSAVASTTVLASSTAKTSSSSTATASAAGSQGTSGVGSVGLGGEEVVVGLVVGLLNVVL